MKLLTIRGIEKQFIINPGHLYNINIENASYYNSLVKSLFIEDTEMFIYSNNNNGIDYNKETLFINDLYTTSTNNKKILNSLYKRINSNPPSSICNDELIRINNAILEIMKKIEIDINLDVEYDTEIDLISLLSLYKFSFKDDYDSNVTKFITYIKANLEVKNFSLIISLNLLSLFNNEELELLKKEFELLGLCLININLCIKEKNNLVEYITIDSDFCQF